MPQEKKSIQSLFLDTCRRKDVCHLNWQESFRDDHPMFGYKVGNLGLGKMFKVRDPLLKTNVLIICTAIGNLYLVQHEKLGRGVKVYIPERLYKSQNFLARKFLLPQGEQLHETHELSRLVGDEEKENNIVHQMSAFLRLAEDCNV